MKCLHRTLPALAVAALLCAPRPAAGAAGVDIALANCPGEAGATQNATIDCANGGSITALVTFAPAEAVSDLIAFDTVVDVTINGGDVRMSTGNFWDFRSANAAALTTGHLRPAGTCGTWLDTWNEAGASSYHSATILSPTVVRLNLGAFRTTDLAVAAGQRLLGYRVTVSSANSVEAGGATGGCRLLARICIRQGAPMSGSGAPTTTLTAPLVMPSLCLQVNDLPVPATPTTWGRIKSLYR